VNDAPFNGEVDQNPADADIESVLKLIANQSALPACTGTNAAAMYEEEPHRKSRSLQKLVVFVSIFHSLYPSKVFGQSYDIATVRFKATLATSFSSNVVNSLV
jgi:hypothetical protein